MSYFNPSLFPRSKKSIKTSSKKSNKSIKSKKSKSSKKSSKKVFKSRVSGGPKPKKTIYIKMPTAIKKR